MRVWLAVAVLLPAPAWAGGRGALNAMAARRAAEAARPSPMAARRSASAFFPAGAGENPFPSPAPSPDPAPPGRSPSPSPAPAPSPGPTSGPKGPLGPRITPPSGTPQTVFNRWRAPGVWACAPAAQPPDEAPLPSIRDQALAAWAAAPASPPAPSVTVLAPGTAGRSYGGAFDPVLFLTGGDLGQTPTGSGGPGRGRSTDPVSPPGLAQK